jgi:hypothetical protein
VSSQVRISRIEFSDERVSCRPHGMIFTILSTKTCRYDATTPQPCYYTIMETIAVGQLMKPKVPTICWREPKGLTSHDTPVFEDELLLICDDQLREVIPGLYTVRVLHPEHGLVTCLLDELTPVN